MNTQEYVVGTYEKILSGEHKTFSPYFFQPQHRKERLGYLVRYLIEVKLGLTPKEALTQFTLADLKKWQLIGTLKYVNKPDEFPDDSVQHLVYFAYPDHPEIQMPSEAELAVQVYQDLLAGRRKTFPKNYFKDGLRGERRAVVCFRYLCEEVLKLEKDQIPATFLPASGVKVMAEYHLKILLNILFQSLIDLMDTAYPGEFDFSRS